MQYPQHTYTITTPNTSTLVVTLDEAKEQLRIESAYTDEDAFITSLIKVATRMAEEELWKPIITQGYRLTLDSFPDVIRLDKFPVEADSVAIQYYDSDNALQTLAPASYLVDYDSKPARIEPADSWPSVYDRFGAVRVTFSAGYGATASDVPVDIRQAILMLVVQLYEERQGKVMKEGLSNAVDSILGFHSNRYWL